MFFVVDRPKLQRLIAITRDDRLKSQQGRDSPFYRIEASEDSLTLRGQDVEAKFPATVYEPGVLFLRVTVFRRLLQTLTGVKTLAIQVNNDGVFVENVHLSLQIGDMLLYADPREAPEQHPSEPKPLPTRNDTDPRQGTLFDKR